MGASSYLKVTDDYKDTIVKLYDDSNTFIEGQLALINTFGFRSKF